jgi:hypothetical protein
MSNKKRRWVEVKITQTMIDRARRSDCHTCLIAIALRAATGLLWTVWYGDAKIDTLFGRKPTWKLPDDIFAIRVGFDAGETIEPCSFRLPARFANKDRFVDWSCEDRPEFVNPYIVAGLLPARSKGNENE